MPRVLMQTFTGHQFDLLNPTPEMIFPEDIAHHLSQLCRFAGATRMFYSVGQHTLNVAEKVGRDSEAWPYALLHDAHEAYTNDITAPMKAVVPGVASIQRAIDEVIWEAFGLIRPNHKIVTLVHMADSEALFEERHSIMAEEIPNLTRDTIWFLRSDLPEKEPAFWHSPEEIERLLLEELQGILPQ